MIEVSKRPSGRGRTLDLVLRYRLALVAVVAFAHAIWDASTSASAGDGILFARAGARLFSGAWSHALADPAIQVGPVHLVFSGVVHFVARFLHISDKLALAVTVEVGSAVALALLVRAVWRTDSAKHQVAELAVCGLWIVWLGGVATAIGQSAESAIPLMWLGAALAARRSRGTVAGIVIGLSAATKAWGLLGLPLLLLDDDHRDAAWGSVWAVGVAAISYAPFMLWGSVGSFSYHWTVSPASPLHYLLPGGSRFTWPERLVQGIFVVGGSSALAWYGRKSPAAVWALPLAIVVMKTLVDPVYYWYYWVPAQTLALVGMAWLLIGERSPVRYAIAAALYGSLFLSTEHPAWLGAICLAAVVASIAEAQRGERVVPPRIPVEVVAAGRAS